MTRISSHAQFGFLSFTIDAYLRVGAYIRGRLHTAAYIFLILPVILAHITIYKVFANNNEIAAKLIFYYIAIDLH